MKNPVLYGEIAVYVPRDKMEKLQREHSEGVLARGEPILKSAGLPYEKEVMGTHGLTALGSMLMGSVATKVVHLSTIPVTLVK